jgi:BirA family biotin operon repressor/biotin-[acetyl-CoA-carboxylase] ligase
MQPWPEGVGRSIHARLDSTNAEALDLCAKGGAVPAWILARQQVKGRGRRGRVWQMPEGNFAASLVMLPEGGPQQAALRSFVAALGLYEALAAATGRAEMFALKWPNDVLLSGGKLAGILLETGRHPSGALALAIGIGVNLNAAPDTQDLDEGAVRPVSLRGETGLSIDAEDFLELLAPAVQTWENRLQTQGFEPLRAAWLARAARRGGDVIARLPGGTIAGRFETIDATGAIVLATAEGQVTLSAADIHFPPRQPASEVAHAAGH